MYPSTRSNFSAIYGFKDRKPADTALTSAEVQQGCILWLPPYNDVCKTLHERQGSDSSPVYEVPKGGTVRLPAEPAMFNRPIVVFCRPATNPEIIFFQYVTTFRGRSLTQRFPIKKQRAERIAYIPLSNRTVHPEVPRGNPSWRNLTLQNELVMEKPGYVNVQRVFCMYWRDAERYWGSDSAYRRTWKLDTDSFRRLTAVTKVLAQLRPSVQYQPPPPAYTADVSINETQPLLSEYAHALEYQGATSSSKLVSPAEERVDGARCSLELVEATCETSAPEKQTSVAIEITTPLLAEAHGLSDSTGSLNTSHDSIMHRPDGYAMNDGKVPNWMWVQSIAWQAAFGVEAFFRTLFGRDQKLHE